MKRRLAILAALALVAAFAARAWHRSGETPTVDPGDGDARRAAEAPAPATLVAPGATPTSAHGRATVEGTVRRSGKPARARVEVRFGHPTGGFLAGHTADRTLREATGFRPRPRTLAIAETGDDGRFAIDGVAPGTNDVVAVAPDGASGTAVVDVAADGTRATVVIELKASLVLRGRARYADGRPFRGRVAITPASWSAQPREDDAVTMDAEGRFTVTGLTVKMKRGPLSAHHASTPADSCGGGDASAPGIGGMGGAKPLRPIGAGHEYPSGRSISSNQKSGSSHSGMPVIPASQ